MTTDSRARPADERQELSLDAAASHLLEECRTVVPGMQVLFVALADGDGLRVQLQDVRYRGGVGPLGDRNPV